MTAVDRVEDVPRGAAGSSSAPTARAGRPTATGGAGAEILDATCPNVKRIHHIVARAEEQGRQPVIIGARTTRRWRPSPDGAAVRWSSPSVEDLEVAGGAAGAAGSSPHICLSNHLHTKIWNDCVKKQKRVYKPRIFDTICGATSKRQEEAHQLAAQCDTMVVIGDGKSSIPSIWRRSAGRSAPTSSSSSGRQTWIW